MKLIRRSSLRSLIPAFALTAVLLLSFLLPSPSAFGQSVAFGYGYGGNNCGIKGNGTHDHGKLCPNRPFPGHGNGLDKAAKSGEAANETSGASGSDEGSTTATTTSTETTSTSVGANHGLARGHSRNHKHGPG